MYPLKQKGLDSSGVIGPEEMQSKEEEEVRVQMDALVKHLLEEKRKKGDLQVSLDVPSIRDPEPSVLFLGTISMKPTMYRGASAIAVYKGGNGILMDCAEGSYG